MAGQQIGARLPLLQLPVVKDEPVPFWLRKSDQLFVGGLLFLAIVLLTAHWARLSRWGLEPLEIERQQERSAEYRLEINTATWVEWSELEGIGPVLGQRIVQDREEHGKFRRMDDLLRVKGIGARTLEKIRPHLELHSQPEKQKPADSSSAAQ